MVKTLTALTVAGAVVAATMVSVPNKAEATPAWVIPVIVAGAFGGVILGSAAANANNAYYGPGYPYGPQGYGPQGTVYVQPRATAYTYSQPYSTTNCRIVRERTASGTRRVEICN